MLRDRSGVPPRDGVPVVIGMRTARVPRMRVPFPRVPGPVGHLLLAGSLPLALLATITGPPGTRPAPAHRSSLAGDSWTLTSRRLVLHGTRFAGVVTVRTPAGTERLLKFTVGSFEAADLDLTVRRGPATWHLRAGAGTVATSRTPTTLYAGKLVGTAFGPGRGTAGPRGRVVISPGSVPYWLSPRLPAARNARRRAVTIEGAALYGIRLTGGTLQMPRPHLTTT
ncbi:hypothetical protein AB0D11_15315 [Streptomyces monashensis]|uniref:hypothetical protein n=1 Tax=Streptomyces monashensis TaxID=1678012 RepID=UPI0034000A91